jgi:hypothetical protein
MAEQQPRGLDAAPLASAVKFDYIGFARVEDNLGVPARSRNFEAPNMLT